MDLVFAQPWWLILSPLSLIPLFFNTQSAKHYSSNIMLPRDRLSDLIFTLIKLLAMTVILLLVAGLAGPQNKHQIIQRIGTGAQIFLLLDRSASMNENFAGRYFGGHATESKVAIARKLLTDLVERRKEDFFGLISFSTAPIHILPLSQDKEAIIAALNASNSRGRGVTNIAPGLSMALNYFGDKPPTGSRVILLVSDGAARITPDTQSKITQHFKQTKAMLYWIYLRNKNSAGLDIKPVNANETSTPEYFLHHYFLGMGIPYRIFAAENPQTMQDAIMEIEKLEQKPITYQQKIPRKNLAEYCYLVAIVGLLLLALVRWLEILTETRNYER